MSADATTSGNDTVRNRTVVPDDEPTQRIEILALSEADTVCAEWMQRGRNLSKRREAA
jgi:hypothetical protein